MKENLQTLIDEQQNALIALISAQGAKQKAELEITRARGRCVAVEANLREFKWNQLNYTRV